MTDAESLLAGIIAHPECDVRRLVYADAIEEAGEVDRAKFIRVQIELARVKCSPRCNLRAAGVRSNGCVCLRADICRREDALWERILDDGDFAVKSPLPRGSCHNVLDRRAVASRLTSGLPILHWRRGFVDAVTCTFTDFEKHGPEIVRRHPIIPHAGMVTDREPNHTSWLRLIEEESLGIRRHRVGGRRLTQREEDLATLPSNIFDFLIDDNGKKVPAYANWWNWNSEESARLALAVALIAQARAANLTPSEANR